MHSIEAVAGMPSRLVSSMTGWIEQAHPIHGPAAVVDFDIASVCKALVGKLFLGDKVVFCEPPPAALAVRVAGLR